MKLNEKASPRRADLINFKRLDGESLRDTYAIHAVEGAEFKVCLAAPGSERPEELKGGEKRHPMLLTFKKK